MARLSNLAAFLALTGVVISGIALAQAPPRVIRRPDTGSVRRDADGTSQVVMDTPEIPVAYARVRPIPHLERALRGDVYWLRGRPRACQRWRFEPLEGGLRLARTIRERIGGGGARAGVWERTEWFHLEGMPPTAHYDIGYSGRWLRAPRGMVASPSGAGAGAGVWPFSIVSVTRDAITWIEATEVVAYHPHDTETWWRSRAACEASRERAR